MKRTISLAVCVALVSASIAQAATLGASSGQVLVDSGAGFQPASAGMALKAGDRVMAKADGKSSIVYNECAVDVVPGSVITVVQDIPCKGIVTGATPAAAPAAAAAAAGGGLSAGVLLGGALVAGGIAAVVASGKSGPSSP